MRASIVPPADKGENKAGEVVAGKRRLLHYSLDDTCALRSHYRQGRVFDSINARLNLTRIGHITHSLPFGGEGSAILICGLRMILGRVIHPPS